MSDKIELSALTEELPIGDVTGGNKMVIETNGFVRHEGQLAARDEMPVYILEAGGNAAPTLVNVTYGGIQRRMYSFNGGVTTEVLGGSFEIPHDYACGTPIEIHVHFRPDDNTAGDVEWHFEWEWSPAQGAPVAQTTIVNTKTVEANTQYHHLLRSLGTLPDHDYKLGDKIGFNLKRIPNGVNDTYTGEALYEQVAMHIWIDTAGSRQLYVK